MVNYYKKLLIIPFLIIIIGFSSCIYKNIHQAIESSYGEISSTTLSDNFFNSRPAQEHISYIYAPGMMGSELLMGRYCPEFTAVTGEKIIWKSGGHVIGQPHTAVLFPELDLRKPATFTLNPLTALMNGLREDLFPLVQRVFQEKFDFVVLDNPQSKSSVANYSFYFSKANIGQKKDIRALHKTYHEHLKHYPETNIILYGDSRGAATIFNFIALHKPKQVKAAILDGIFDDVPHCIKHFLYNDKQERTEKRMHDLIAFFMGSYNKKGPFPIDYADYISDDIPLLMVTSLKDGLTAPQCAINFYLKLKNRGYQKVHLLILKEALHPCYMIDNIADRELYETTVHAFYKHYQLPHNKERAAQGQKSFEKTQPSIDDLKHYQLSKCALCTL